MKDEDLAPFAVAGGLLARMSAERPGKLTDAEHLYLVNLARETLARATGETLEAAGRTMHQAATEEGGFELRCSDEFAIVTIYGRLLVVLARVELAGRVHPEHN